MIYCLGGSVFSCILVQAIFRGTRLRDRFASSFGQTGVRGLPALTGRAPGALW